MKLLNNQPFHRPVIASIVLLVLINIIRFALSINDLFYFRKIQLGKAVSESAHAFFIKKNEIEYWVSNAAYIVFIISFLVWFYHAYRNVYVRESSEAPYKPGIVPFSYLIPIFNLYAPYQIMRFIWWGNATTSDELMAGYKTIKLWWFISIMNVVLSRIASGVYEQSKYANEFTRATFFYIFIYVLSIHFLLLTYKLIVNISKAHSYR